MYVSGSRLNFKLLIIISIYIYRFFTPLLIYKTKMIYLFKTIKRKTFLIIETRVFSGEIGLSRIQFRRKTTTEIRINFNTITPIC